MDLYLIYDWQSRPAKGDSKNYLGKLKDNDFQLLQELAFIEARYDYYKDLRWSSDEVKNKYERLAKFIVSDGRLALSTCKFSEFLGRALKGQMGIIGYAD